MRLVPILRVCRSVNAQSTGLARGIGRWIAIGASVVFLANSNAQWATLYLNPGSESSDLYGVSGVQQVGQVYSGGVVRASVWSRSASSWVDLHLAGAMYSIAHGVHGGQQVGYVEVGGAENASLWSGTAASRVSLHPAGASKSYAYGVFNGRQVGAAKFGDFEHAGMWTGTADSWIDLHPPGAAFSQAFAVSGGQQAGYANFGGGNTHAGLWNGTADSWTDLHPAGASNSTAWCISDTNQAGNARFGGITRAGLWTGTAASWVDLHPAGALIGDSNVYGVSGTSQAGVVRVDGATHASVWTGSAGSWVDLHQFLPPEYDASEARCVWEDGGITYVVGFGYLASSGNRRAIIWISPASSCDGGIDRQPDPVALLPNQTATFTIETSGIVQAYEWRKNGTPVTNGDRVTGADAATLTISNVQASDQGGYQCFVTVPCEPLTSAAAELSCRPIVTAQPPASAVLRAGLQLSLGVPTGAQYSYRWRQNGQNLFNGGFFAGVTTRTLTLLGVDPSLAGSYDCLLTDSCGTTLSEASSVYCPSDFDMDGFISGPDFDLFVQAFETGDMASDFNGDGFITGEDFDQFVQTFEAGC